MLTHEILSFLSLRVSASNYSDAITRTDDIDGRPSLIEDGRTFGLQRTAVSSAPSLRVDLPFRWETGWLFACRGNG